MAKNNKEEKKIKKSKKLKDEKKSIAEIKSELSKKNAELDDIKEQLETSKEKSEKNWELYLSAKAETDNVRKRAERDVTNAHKYALEKFIPELLTVKDSLELGIKAAKENCEEQNEQMKKFVEGNEMSVNIFIDVLKKVGVEVINPEGEKFNPEFHQAITMAPNPDIAANTIIEVIQKGYTLNKRLLRPAMVVVSKEVDS